MTTNPVTKRSRLLWLRALDIDQLHALTHKLRRDFIEGDISDRQDWLLDQCFAELEARAADPARPSGCCCSLCEASWDLESSYLLALADSDDQAPF